MFQKDSRTENFLNQMGVSWKYTNNIKPEQLDPRWSQVNIGRSGGRSQLEEAILEYACLMEAGSAAPAPILAKDIQGFHVLDGVQRLSAAIIERKETIISAYVCDIDNEMLARLVRTMANARLSGNHAPSKKENIILAVSNLVLQSGGMSIDEVARIGGWAKRDVEKEFCRLETMERLRQCGLSYDVVSKLQYGIAQQLHDKLMLSDYQHAPDVIGDFATALIVGKFENGDATEYVSQFADVKRNRKDIYDQFRLRYDEFINDEEVQTRLNGRKVIKVPADKKIVKALKTSLRVVQDAVKDNVTVHNTKELFDLLSEIRGELVQLRKHKVG